MGTPHLTALIAFSTAARTGRMPPPAPHLAPNLAPPQGLPFPSVRLPNLAATVAMRRKLGPKNSVAVGQHLGEHWIPGAAQAVAP